MKGKLIVFEGGEGGGKTTQMRQTCQWLRSRIAEKSLPYTDAIATREPGGTTLGKSLRQLLLEGEAIQSTTELLLYAADRAQHVEEFLKPYLAQGAIVLCDRFTDSTIAYQGYGRGLNLELIAQLNQIATGGLQSDLTFWLDISAEAGLARTQKRGLADRMEQADLAFHQRVLQGFAALYQEYPERITRIDASASQTAVQTQIQQVLTERLQQWSDRDV